MTTMRMYDSLGYAKSLVSKGVEKKIAEAIAETNQEYLIDDLATKAFVQAEIGKINNKIEKSALEQKLWTGKLAVATVSILLAGFTLITKFL